MFHPNPRLFLYTAMADAYAIATEYVRGVEGALAVQQALKFERYLAHPSYGLPPARYTDDTERFIGNALVLLEDEPPYTKLMFANAYVDEHLRGGLRKGYSRGMQGVLGRAMSGTELLAEVRGNSTMNGGCMGAAVFGVLPTVQEALEAATVQATVTHDSPEGRFSARAIALLSQFALWTDEPLFGAAEYCMQNLPQEDIDLFGGVFRKMWDGGRVTTRGDASVAITTVHAVTHLVTRERSLMDMLRRTIEWGGDTDTVAALAWAIASARFQDEPLPAFLPRDLEPSSQPYLLRLGERLMEKFNPAR